MVEHAEIIRKLYHGMHGVLDDHNGNAFAVHLPDDRQDIFELVMSEAGERLVEQQQFGARRERARKLHQAELLGGQCTGERMGLLVGQSDALERLVGERLSLVIGL